MKNLNRVTYKNSFGKTASCKAGEEMTQYLKENFEIVSIEYAEVEKEAEVKKESKEIEVGKTYKVGNRVRTVVFVGKTDSFFGGEKEVVRYSVKDGSERFETLESFKKWMAKGLA